MLSIGCRVCGTEAGIVNIIRHFVIIGILLVDKMSLKLFRGGILNEAGEREQLSQIIDLLSRHFNDRDNNIYLVIDPKFPGATRAPRWTVYSTEMVRFLFWNCKL